MKAPKRKPLLGEARRRAKKKTAVAPLGEAARLAKRPPRKRKVKR